MSPAAAAGSLFSLAPQPTVEIRYKFLAPELSAQLITAPTGRANDIRNLFPDAPPRPLFEAMVFLFASQSADSANLSIDETAQTIQSLCVIEGDVVLPVYSPKELLLLGGLYKSQRLDNPSMVNVIWPNPNIGRTIGFTAPCTACHAAHQRKRLKADWPHNATLPTPDEVAAEPSRCSQLC